MNLKFHSIIIFFTLLFSIQEKTKAQAPNCLWANAFGSIGEESGQSITVDSIGNVYTTGYFKNTVDFDPGIGTFDLVSSGSNDIFILKLDPYGNFVWAKKMGGTVSDAATSIVLDSDGNIYTTGSYVGTADFDPGPGIYNLTFAPGSTGTADIFISKLDPSGNFIWAKSLGGTSSDFGHSIAVDDSGNVYTTGYFSGTADFNPNISFVYNLVTSASFGDVFVSKLDSLGNFVWAKKMGGPGDDYGTKIVIDDSSNVFTIGITRGGDFDPGIGIFNLTSYGVRDVFISKLNISGNFVWAKNIGGPFDDEGRSIVIDDSANIYYTGFFQGTADFDPGPGVYNLTSIGGGYNFFISKIDSSSNFVWAKKIGGYGNTYGYSIALDESRNVYTTGIFDGLVDFDPSSGIFNLSPAGGKDIFINKLNNTGDFVWAKSVGTACYYDMSTSMAIDNTDNLFLTGYFRCDSTGFDLINFTNSDTGGTTSDIFVAKFGNIITEIADIQTYNSISLYPNPTTDIFTVSFEKNIKQIELNIFDITGKIIYTTTESSTQQIEVNTKDFSSGIYFVQIISSDFVETRKLVVAK